MKIFNQSFFKRLLWQICLQKSANGFLMMKEVKANRAHTLVRFAMLRGLICCQYMLFLVMRWELFSASIRKINPYIIYFCMKPLIWQTMAAATVAQMIKTDSMPCLWTGFCRRTLQPKSIYSTSLQVPNWQPFLKIKHRLIIGVWIYIWRAWMIRPI